MSQTWAVIDEAGERHDVEVTQVNTLAWRARMRGYEASVLHDDERGAVVLAAMRDGINVVEVIEP
jgi:hypothetical protein